jgi:phage-related baseplate assembly protein
MTQESYRKLCIRLLIAIDSGNAKAEDHVLCQIRQAVKDEENRAMTLSATGWTITANP